MASDNSGESSRGGNVQTRHDGHHHGHDHHGLGDANAAHFDKHVAAPETPGVPSTFQKMYNMFEKELVEQRSWFGIPSSSSPSPSSSSSSPTQPQIRLLDYACGGGHASRTLLPYIHSAVGVDVSARSVEHYNAWAAEHGAAERMRGAQGNIMTDDGFAALAAELGLFDVVVCIMALHHVHDPPLALRRLAAMLRPGGTLLVIDWNENGCTRFPRHHHPLKHAVTAHGFGEADMAEHVRQAAELGLFDVVVCIMALHHVHDPPLALRRLAAMLRPGGTLLVIDWNENGCTRFPRHHHPLKHAVTAHGFGEADMAEHVRQAGCEGFAYRELRDYTEDGVVAMTRARRPA